MLSSFTAVFYALWSPRGYRAPGFIALDPAALTDVEEHVFRYYLDCKGYFEPGEPGYVEIESAKDVWKHVGFGPDATVGLGGGAAASRRCEGSNRVR